MSKLRRTDSDYLCALERIADHKEVASPRFQIAGIVFMLALAVVFWFASCAHAPAQSRGLPAEFQGLWCSYSNDGKGTDYYLRNDASAPQPDTPCTKDGADWIMLDRNGYHGHEHGCQGIKSIKVVRRELVMPKVSHPVYQVIFDHCSGEGSTWNESWTVYIARGGVLTIQSKSTNVRKQGLTE